MLCKFKNLFGQVNHGVHSIRLFNIAIIDVLITIFLAYFINIIFPKYKFKNILIQLFLLSIILHHLFCVKTTINKLLFP